MLVYWMPYLTLTYPHRGPKQYAVGKAQFVPDTPANWSNIVGCPRPKHLEIHRDFPPRTTDKEPKIFGDPLYGTLVHCEDELWLADHIDAAVAVLYFLGDDFMRGLPAECFLYHGLRVTGQTMGDSDFVGYTTKHAELWESSQSLVLLPPLAVRGNHSPYRPDLDKTEHQALLKRISDDPIDRLVVAVRQYFRTQFSDIFTSPLTEDYALHCGAIEAALDINSLESGVGGRFVQALMEVYGEEDRFKDFFYGLYVSRSLFVHGASVAYSPGIKKMAAYELFKNTKGKITLLRAITRDIICHALGREKSIFSLFSSDSALPLLRKVLHSDATWDETRVLLTKAKATDLLTDMRDVDFESVEEVASKLTEFFDWQCVQRPVERKHVLRCICTCALAIARLTGSTGDVYAQSDQLGRAADAGDDEAIETWIIRNSWHQVRLEPGNRLSVMQQVARSLAKYFDRHHIVHW